MCVRVCAYVCVCVDVRMYLYNMRTCLRCVYVLHACMHVCTHVWLHACMHLCVHWCINSSICVSIVAFTSVLMLHVCL